MRILHLLGQHPAKTGSGTSFRAIIAGLARHEHEQVAIYGLNEDQEPVDVGCEAYPVIFSEKEDGFPLFGMSDLMPYPSLRFSDMTEDQFAHWSGRFLHAFHEAEGGRPFDVIIGHHLHLLVALITRHTDTPVIGVSHGTDLAQLDRNPKHLRYVKEALRDIPLIVTNSPEQNKDVTRLLGTPNKRIRVLGGGFDPTVFYPGDPAPPPPIRMVYTGKISEHKGLRPLYYALHQLKEEFDFVLTVAGTGEGEETEALIRLGESLELPIDYRGFVSQKELGELYRTQHIFVLPSFAEGLSLATLEALGAGLLCATSNLPNLRAFLPKHILESGQIAFAESFSETPIKEENPRFSALVYALQKCIELQCRKMLTSGQKLGIVEYNEITWYGRVDLLHRWISDNITLF